MNRARTIAAIFGVALVSLLFAVPAFAQEQQQETNSPIVTTIPTTTTTTASTTTTTIEVSPTSVVRSTTTEAPTTTTTEAPTSTVQVKDEVVVRPLPRTGGDIGGPTLLGLGLTAAGIVLAVGARRRRHRFDTVDS